MRDWHRNLDDLDSIFLASFCVALCRSADPQVRGVIRLKSAKYGTDDEGECTMA